MPNFLKHSKQLERNIRIRDHNRHQMRHLIDISIKRIQQQGDGCFIDGYGTAYRDPDTNRKDSIAIVCSIPDKYLDKHYGLISGEYQKPIVKHLIKKFMIDVSRDCERFKFIDFLQHLQDAHDIALEESEFMSTFKTQCEDIKKEFKL